MANFFSKKSVEIHITLASGSFSGGGSTKVIKGLAVQVRVEKPGLPDKGKATCKIYNLPLNDMEQITTLAFRPLYLRRNTIIIFAGDENSGLYKIYEGEIVNATADFNTVPDPTFLIEAMSGYFGSVTPSSPMAIKGSLPVSDVVSTLVKKVGYGFVNQGVVGSLVDTVLNGSPLEQAQSAANQSGSDLQIDDGTVSLLPKGAAVTGPTVDINASTGMIGYPTFNNQGVVVKTIFAPSIQFNGTVNVRSIVPKTTGNWRVIKLTHSLAAYNKSETDWVTEIETVSFDAVI